MKKELNWTGERLVSSLTNEYGTVEHLHRYSLALEICKDKKVLDIASGEGYGSNFLSTVANFVYGVDISEEAVKHAQEKYVKNNLIFKAGSASNVPLPEKEVDVVVSFETLEHHDKHDEMMQEIKRVLKPNGILLISSPEKAIYKFRDPNNIYHVKELYLEDFKKLLGKYFRNVEIFDQRFVFGSIITNPNFKESNGFGFYNGNFEQINHNLDTDPFYNKAFFNLALASDGVTSNTFPDSSFFSGLNVLHAMQNQHQKDLKAIRSSKQYLLSLRLLSLKRRIQKFFKL